MFALRKKQCSCFSTVLIKFVLLICSIFTVPNSVFAQPEAFKASKYARLPAGSLVMMADGNSKAIEHIQAGDILASYDPATDQLVTTYVLATDVHKYESEPLVSVMLVQEELTASLQVKGGTLGIVLQITPAQPVLTQWGKKEAGQLREGDKVYCYDDATRLFHTFSVYGVSVENQPAKSYYRLSTDKQNFLVNGAVLLEE